MTAGGSGPTAGRCSRSLRQLVGFLAVLALLVAGCASSARPGAVASTVPSADASRGVGDGRGCQRAPLTQPPGSTAEQTLASDGQQRSFRLHLPVGYSPDRAYGLVLAFHGRGETDGELETYSGLDRLPAIVAYPQGLPGTAGKSGWQGTPYAAPQADDIAFAGALIAHLQATLCVDAAKIDATGKSDGGGLAALLACRIPEIHAIAVVSGAFYTSLSSCRPAHGVAVLNFHGAQDTVIPYAGDPGRGLLSVPAWLAGWVTRNSCRQPSTTFFDQDGVEAQQWSGCIDQATVENYRIAAGGHTWTGSPGNSGPGGNTTAISATDLIGAFFAAH